MAARDFDTCLHPYAAARAPITFVLPERFFWERRNILDIVGRFRNCYCCHKLRGVAGFLLAAATALLIGATSYAQDTEKAAKSTAHATEKAAKKTAQGTEKAADATASGAKNAADATVSGTLAVSAHTKSGP